LNERDTVRVKPERPRGILQIGPPEVTKGLARYWPSSGLAPFIEHYWIVRWDLRTPHVAETVPHPSVHMVLEAGRAEIVGIMRSRFSRVLEGRGRVVGTKFLPGAFRPFVTHPVSRLTDRRVPVADVFGTGALRLGERALRHDDDFRSIAVIESFLLARRPVCDDAMALAGRAAARIAQDRDLKRVDELARELGTTVRGLQRLFAEYIGASPKWVIRRYRLLDAVERVASGVAIHWPDLALDLGYSDQAHFIRDFKKLIGTTPADYARRLSSRRGTVDLQRPAAKGKSGGMGERRS
jgi:AraC-like DNA-binding protein